MQFYRSRIPSYNLTTMLHRTMILVMGVACAALSRYEVIWLVTLVSAAASILTSWTEFSDIERKVERYSSAVLELENILAWWDSLDDVQRAAKANISRLIRTCEAIITYEQGAWSSTSMGNEKQDDENVEKEEKTGVKLAKVAPTSNEPASFSG